MIEAEHSEHDIGRELGRALRIALEDALCASDERLTVLVFSVIFAYCAGSYRADKVRLGRDDSVQACAVHALDGHAHYIPFARELRDARNSRDNAELIEVVEIGIVDRYIFLRGQENFSVARERRFQRIYRFFSANIKMHLHAGKHHETSQSNGRHKQSRRFKFIFHNISSFFVDMPPKSGFPRL